MTQTDFAYGFGIFVIVWLALASLLVAIKTWHGFQRHRRLRAVERETYEEYRRAR
jgi:hypothetical protein